MYRLSTTILAAGLSAALTAATPAMAQEGPEKGQAFASLLGGYYDAPSDTQLEDGGAGLGGGLGYMFSEEWAVEGLYFDFEPDVRVGPASAEGDMGYWSLNVLHTFGGDDTWQPYFTAGAGRAEYSYGRLRGDRHDTLVNAGVGFFASLNDRLMFRADLRGVYHENANTTRPMATAGLSLLIGDPASATPAQPADADGDGVADERDACPGTASGTPVDARGCPRDSDGDGVADGDDRCPDTPAGVSVDDQGCAQDSDDDGVADHRDDCPGTPAGARVDDSGCEVQLEKPVSFDLTVEFGFDSAEITGVAFQEMLDLLSFLREYPSTTAVIEGHSDDRGPADYNQNLSEHRANAVKEALVNSGIDRDRLTARGYGESRPIASNETEQGRQQNRRVTVVVSGTAPAG